MNSNKKVAAPFNSFKLIIVKCFVIFFLLLGAIGWFLPFMGWFLPWTGWPLSIEAPNSEPHGIILDSMGNIYCGSKFYGRIQKYFPDGKFARGYDTEGGTGWGSDFGFKINKKDQLSITVSGISKDNKGSVHRTKIYDDKGKLIHTEKSETTERAYAHDMIDFAIDSSGNRYTFKGFLFPRIVKRSTSGQKSNIIATPVWLWFLQSPFPAFAFFFVSIVMACFIGYKEDAAKLSIPTSNLIFGIRRVPSLKKVLFLAIGIIGIVIPLSIIIPLGVKNYPWLGIFGFLSFVLTLVVIVLLTIICQILYIWRCAKVDSKTLKNSFSFSLKKRHEAYETIRSLMNNDPVMKKTGKTSIRIALTCLIVWFVVLVLAICVVLFLDHIGLGNTNGGN